MSSLMEEQLSTSPFSCSLKAHGATQLQLKVSYPFERRKVSHFRTEVYFLVPEQLSIRLDERGRKSLLDDTRTNTRFAVAHMSLSLLADQKHRDNPIQHIISHIEHPKKIGVVPVRRIVYELRTFGNLYTVQLKETIRMVRHVLSTQSSVADCNTLGKQTVSDVKKALALFRELRATFLDPAIPQEVRDAHALADEYIGDQTVRHMLGLSNIVAREEGLSKLHSQVRKLLSRELTYQTKRGYSVVRSDTIDPRDMLALEKLIVRESRLKKWVQSVLYLDTTESGTSRRVQHMVAGVAAALAMSVGVLASVYADMVFSQHSTPWALLVVGAYIVRDRIKEVVRSTLVRYVPVAVSDRTRILKDPDTEERVGRNRLAIRSVDPRHVPQRPGQRGHDEILTETVPHEALLFATTMRLKGRSLLESHQRVNGVVDIMRIRLDKWLRDMDAPTKGVRLFVDGDGLTVVGRRTYRIRVAVRLVSGNEQVGQVRFWTVVLSREGLVRIEAVHATTTRAPAPVREV